MNATNGGPYSHDIDRIFPVFSADVEDPAPYDFANTDESILVCKAAGTQTFFRLGQTIEHQIKKTDAQYEIYLTDEGHSGARLAVTDKLEFELKLHSILLIKEI